MLYRSGVSNICGVGIGKTLLRIGNNFKAKMNEIAYYQKNLQYINIFLN